MAITMYAMVKVSDGSKIMESTETTHLSNGNEAWLPIRYMDKPEAPAGKVVERDERLEGAEWVKGWSIRKQTADEKKAEKLAKNKRERRELQAKLEDAVYALATGGDLSEFIAAYESLTPPE
jgi:hypothetical protein